MFKYKNYEVRGETRNHDTVNSSGFDIFMLMIFITLKYSTCGELSINFSNWILRNTAENIYDFE